MPLTQEQMIEQMQEARANHQEMRALRDLILNYAEHCLKTYPANAELCESMRALAYTVRLRAIPDDRVTFLNERYYARFASRNAKAKQRQTLIRAGLIVPRAGNSVTRDMPSRQKGPPPIFPKDYPDDAPLEFDSMSDLPARESQEEKFLSGLQISLDESGEPCDTTAIPTKETGAYKMTKKDFDRLARAVRMMRKTHCLNDARTRLGEQSYTNILETIVDQIALACGDLGDNFDYDCFTEACHRD
jgi:hypothetical protein